MGNGKTIKGYANKGALLNNDAFLFQRGNEYFYVNAEAIQSGSTIDDTRANVNTLKTGSNLSVGALYYLTDKYIWVNALDVDKIAYNALFLARNADYNSAGVYSGITIANGFTVTATGVNLGVWTSALAPASGEVSIWDNLHWLNITGANGGNDPSADGVNWESVSNTNIATAFTYGYIQEIDAIEYDFVGDVIQQRIDLNSNIIQGTQGINNWRWGDSLVTGNRLTTGSYLAIKNTFGTITDNELNCKINEVNCIINSGISFTTNYLNVGSSHMTIAYNTTNNYFVGKGAIGIHPQQALTATNASAGLGSDWTETIELTSAAYGAGTVYLFGDYAQSGTISYMNINPLGTTGVAPGGSDWVAVFDVTAGAGRHILNITEYHNMVGIINLTSTNATETIDEIVWGDGYLLANGFYPDTALVATFASTAIAALAITGEIIANSSRVFDGGQHEWGTFEEYSIGGTEYARWIYGRTDYA